MPVCCVSSQQPLDWLRQGLEIGEETRGVALPGEGGEGPADIYFLRLDINSVARKRLPGRRKALERLLAQVAELLATEIIARREPEILDRILQNAYGYFTPPEREDICARTRKILDAREVGGKGPSRPARFELIRQRVADYLAREEHLNVEGFINFRLQDYLEELDEALEEAVDDFLMDREYHEFIRLLRHFVEAQEPRVEKVHVLLHPSGCFQLYDGKEKSLLPGTPVVFSMDLEDSEINYEDLLISALITIAPGKIWLHSTDPWKNRETLTTVKNVFGERVELCPGCSHCLRRQTNK